MQPPYIVTIARRKKRQPLKEQRTSFRDLTRSDFRSERIWDFLLELVLFALLTGISAWPMIHVVEALRSL